MRRVWSLAAVALWAAAFAAGSGQAADIVEVPALVFQSERWDGAEVEVSGEARELKRRVSKAGRPYTTFRLVSNGGRWVRVFSWGEPSLWDGRPVTVVGTFHAVKKLGSLTFRKEIEAAEIR